MAAILAHRDIAPLLSDEHFSVDGTFVKAWHLTDHAPGDHTGPVEAPKDHVEEIRSAIVHASALAHRASMSRRSRFPASVRHRAGGRHRPHPLCVARAPGQARAEGPGCDIMIAGRERREPICPIQAPALPAPACRPGTSARPRPAAHRPVPAARQGPLMPGSASPCPAPVPSSAPATSRRRGPRSGGCVRG